MTSDSRPWQAAVGHGKRWAAHGKRRAADGKRDWYLLASAGMTKESSQREQLAKWHAREIDPILMLGQQHIQPWMSCQQTPTLRVTSQSKTRSNQTCSYRSFRVYALMTLTTIYSSKVEMILI